MRSAFFFFRLFLFAAISLLWAAAPSAIGQAAGSVTINSFTLSASTVTGGSVVTGTITGYNNSDSTYPVSVNAQNVVTLSPGSFYAPPGSFNQTEAISTMSVSTATNVSIFASATGSSKVVTLRILPPVPASLTFASTSSPTNPPTAGDDATATVTLNGPAASGGASVTLSVFNVAPSGATVTVPASVTVPAGSTTATFTVTSSQNSSSDVTANIVAVSGGTHLTDKSALTRQPFCLRACRPS